jgi:hypothetical protein
LIRDDEVLLDRSFELHAAALADVPVRMR